MEKEHLHIKKNKGLARIAKRGGFSRIVDFRDAILSRTKGASRKFTTGFSLVELLVSISVFMIFVTATVGIISNSTKQVSNTNNKVRATALAEEGLEAARNIRDVAWTNVTVGTYGLSSSGNQWSLSSSNSPIDIFTRTLTISDINANQKKVNSTVTWSDSISANNFVSLNTYLTNWRAPLSIGLTIDKVVVGGVKVPSDFLPVNLNTDVWDNTVDPPVLNNINIPISFSPSTMTGLSPGVYTFTTSSDPDYTLSLSSACVGNSITLTNGAILCTITYTSNNVVPTITTTVPIPATITQTTAVSGGTITSDGGVPVAVSGLVWSTSVNPTTANSKTTDGLTGVAAIGVPWTSSMTGLTCNTLYHVRAYATNTIGTGYGDDITFTTSTCNVVPIVTSPTSISIGTTTATLGANVTSLGIPASISARGVCYGTTPSPTSCVAEGGTTTGVFTKTVTGLTPGILYYYRGYATNATGTGYSSDGTFTTTAVCSVASALVGTPTLYNGSSTSASVTMPTGVVKDDIMFASIMHFNATDQLATIPTGWISIGRHKNGSYNQALYYKVALAGEAGPYVFGLSTSSKFAVTISAYRGCFDPTNPIDTSSNIEYVSNDTTYRAASVTLSTTNITVLMFPSMYTTTVRTFANPLTQSAGWTEDYDQGSTVSAFSRAAYRKFISASGATGVIDSIGTKATTVKHAFAVALHPL